jgi:hypothetical protein
MYYNVILKRVRVTTVAMETQQYLQFFFFAVDLGVGVENIKTVEVFHGSTKKDSLCIVVELQNILYCYRQYRSTVCATKK